MLYHFPRTFNEQYGFMQPYQQAAYRGWVGAVMLVDYATSGVGAYQELLYIPGCFKLDGKWVFSISKIYVSTYDSVWNGIENWGIPKELADFAVQKDSTGIRRFSVSQTGVPFFSAELKPWSFALPVSSSLLPPLRIVQERRNALLLTQPQASGKAQLATLKSVQADAAYFPPLQHLKPLLVSSIPRFTMTFPLPKLL